MRWEELTGDQFPQAIKDVNGVCLLPLSCIERHAHHLPLGTDMFIARELCRRAALLEPAIIYPDFFYTQILEARHYPGTIAVDPELFLRLLAAVCGEIGRNGLHKIVIVNAHGGNDHLIHFFAQSQLAGPRDYVVYVAELPLAAEDGVAIKAQWETTVDGHAGESETSAVLVIHPELVDKSLLRSDNEGMPLNRLKTLTDAGVYTGIWWYADHPTHYYGDGRAGTAEKGERLLAAQAQALAKAIRLIKEDQITKRLQDDFYAASKQHGLKPA